MLQFEKVDMLSGQPIVCPACTSEVTDIRYRYIVNDGQKRGESYFYRCRECSFIFARPVLIPELNQRQMDGVESAEMFNSAIMKWLYTNLFLKPEISTLRRLTNNRPGCRLLDIGCGTGWTTKIFQEHGFYVTGLEPSPVRARIARERYGLEIINDYLENIPVSSGGYDVIIMHHVIEHFTDPEEVMHRVNELLAQDGLVAIIVPNINCLGRYIFETSWTWGLPWHCSFFTPRSLSALMNRSHFIIEKIRHIPSPYYFPDSMLRAFPKSRLLKFVARNMIFLRLILAPLTVIGTLAGKGDNLSIFAKKVNADSVCN